MNRNWIIPGTAALVFALDVFSKQWALAHLTSGFMESLIPGLLNVTLTTNTGGAFGIGRQFKLLMTMLPIGICVGIIYWLFKRQRSGFTLSIWECVGYGLVLGGASGNIFERLLRGHVTDFLSLAFMDFPVFNVADALIDAGVVVVVLHSILSKPQQNVEEQAGQENG